MTFIAYRYLDDIADDKLLNALYYHADVEIHYMVFSEAKIKRLMGHELYMKVHDELVKYRTHCWELLDKGHGLMHGIALSDRRE